MPKISNQQLEKEVRALIAEIVEIEPEKITPEVKFVEDLGMDSMMSLEILGSLEKKYKIRIPEENLPKMTNFRQVLDMLNKFIK